MTTLSESVPKPSPASRRLLSPSGRNRIHSSPTNSPNSIALVCTPNLAILDSWYPSLKFAKLTHPEWKIGIIFPSVYQVKKIDTADAVVVGCQEVASFFIYVGLDARLYAFKNLPAAKRAVAKSLRLARFFVPKTHKSTSPPLIDAMMAQCDAQTLRSKIFCLCLLLWPRHGWLSNRPRNSLVNLLRSATVAYDTLSQGKRGVLKILSSLLLGPRLSIRHGLGLLEPFQERDAARLREERNHQDASKKDFRIYVHNDLEKSIYVEQLWADPKQVTVTGIPRLDPIAQDLIRALPYVRNTMPWERHILFISRSLDKRDKQYKRDCLELVHKFACENGLGLVVRTHPSELGTEIRGALPPEGEGSTWVLSSAHPQQLAKDAQFAVSFASSLPAELLAFGVPTIEFGLTPDSRSAPSRESHRGLVLRVTTHDEFHDTALALLHSDSGMVAPLYESSRIHYASPLGAIKTIVADLETLSVELHRARD